LTRAAGRILQARSIHAQIAIFVRVAVTRAAMHAVARRITSAKNSNVAS